MGPQTRKCYNGNGNALVIPLEHKSDYSVMQLAVRLLQRIARSTPEGIFHQSFTVINFKGEKLKYFLKIFFAFVDLKNVFQQKSLRILSGLRVEP